MVSVRSLALVLAAGLPAAAADSAGRPPASAVTAAESYLRARADNGTLSGAVLVAQGGRPLLRMAFGVAEAEHAVPNTPDSVFRIGSLTKTVTAAAALAEVAAGRLRLEDSICGFLPSCPEPWRPVSLHHLLSHTSGVPDLFGNVEAAPVLETRRAIDQAIVAAESTALLAAPGEVYAYSNFNYMLVGYALEVASGKPWEEVLDLPRFRGRPDKPENGREGVHQWRRSDGGSARSSSVRLCGWRSRRAGRWPRWPGSSI